MISILTSGDKDNIVIFIHGFLGGDSTWLNKKKPKGLLNYILDDEVIANNFDVATFAYFTRFFQSNMLFQQIKGLFGFRVKVNLSIDDISDLLESEIKVKLRRYSRVVIVSHSMGGLVTKSYIIKNLNKHKVNLFVSLAVPHNGSKLAQSGKLVSSNVQINNLVPLNSRINFINSEWVKIKNIKFLPKTIYHQGKLDKVVTKESAIGFDAREIEIIYSNHHHTNIHSPSNRRDVVVESSLFEIKNVLSISSTKKTISEGGESITSGGVTIVNSNVKNSFNRK